MLLYSFFSSVLSEMSQTSFIAYICNFAVKKILFIFYQDAYLKILPLYFPRNETEEKIAVTELPLDIGNEDGEPVIPERQIRIMDKPTLAAMSKYEQGTSYTGGNLLSNLHWQP